MNAILLPSLRTDVGALYVDPLAFAQWLLDLAEQARRP